MTEYVNKNLNIAAKTRSRRGFSLIEIVTVMVISSMVMISTLAIFNRVKSATASINRKLDEEDVADEILQRIAEDLDRLATVGFDTTVTINSKKSAVFNKCQLIIENKFYDKSSKAKTFEKVVWQSEYDALEGMTILYRHHGGLCLEDKILDGELEDKQADGNELYIPICWGMTFFEIVIPKKDADPLTKWSSADLPTSVAVTISFAEPVENFDGTWEVAEEDRITRHIAIDRTRMPEYVFKKKDFSKPDLDDPNDMDSNADPNDTDGFPSDDKDSNNSTDTAMPKGTAGSGPDTINSAGTKK
jgi:prepilin-type N-terminal cleavage/methylation domain-containing protein